MRGGAAHACNRALDGLVRPVVLVLGRPVPAFHVCGFAGYFLALAMAVFLSWRLGLSPWIGAALALCAAFAFLALAVGSKLLFGRVTLVLYHHALLVLGVSALVARALQGPVLPYLDVAALSFAVFHVCGRLGCLLVGCCHGPPHPFGAVYGPRHAAAGFDPWLFGVRLFPTQLIEAVTVLVLLAVATALCLGGRLAPGGAFALYLGAYAALRFLLELWRGDAARPHAAGFSEGQWTSVAVTLGLLGLARWGGLPPSRAYLAEALTLSGLLVFIAGWRFLGGAPRLRLLAPQHVREVAHVLTTLAQDPGSATALRIGCTSLGVQLSLGRSRGAQGPIEHVSLSRRDPPLAEEQAQVLVDLVMRLRAPRGPSEIVPGRDGVYHLLLHP